MRESDYRETDREGHQTLDVIGRAGNFNRWMFSSIMPFCNGEVFEVGCGIGNMSVFFLNGGCSLSTCDIRQKYCEIVREKYAGNNNLRGVSCMDIADPAYMEKYPELHGSYDTVFALNVLEHIKDDRKAIENCRYLLKNNGILIVLVPAGKWLYNTLDRELFHYRRYNRKELSTLLSDLQFDIVKTFSFNAAGIPGWWFSGKVQRNKIIPLKQMSLYNRLVPLFRLIDRLLFRSVGLSVVIVGRKE
ncbi:MAG: class I SAM-dependent methyltransferase [Bacteroidetes bacterium]|nr:class I SAM-dependent methyltransferase [Bacteroidota bacterium]